MGVLLAGLAARHLDEGFNLSKGLGALATSNVTALIGYLLLLAIPLYLVARRVHRGDG
jgi:hypothetical protein